MVIKAVTASGDTFPTIWEKLFKEVLWNDDKPMIGLIPNAKSATTLLEAFALQGRLNVDTVRRVLTNLPKSVFIVDEFDRAAATTSQEFTDLIKALSDFGVDTTVILVGVAETVDRLIVDHASIGRSLIQVLLPRMKAEDLKEILKYAEKSLEISFADDAADLIVKMSQGLPHYTHLIGLNAVRTAALDRFSDYVERVDVFAALKLAVKHAEQSTANKYSKATHSGQKDALYKQVLLACAITATKAHDALGYFNPASVTAPLAKILNKPVAVATYTNHLSEFIQSKRGNVLEREGQARGYRYRFHDPLLVPFVFMSSISEGLLTDETLTNLVS